MKLGGLDKAFSEEGFDFAGVRIGEGDEGFLDAAEVERRLVLAHGLLQAFHIAVSAITIEQLQEEAEVFRVPLVRRGGHQEVVVRHARQGLAKLVGEGLVVAAGGAHFVRLIYDNEVPVAAEEAFFGV